MPRRLHKGNYPTVSMAYWIPIGPEASSTPSTASSPVRTLTLNSMTMKERLFKATHPEWRSNIYNVGNLNAAYLSLLSNYAKIDLYEQLRWDLAEDFIEAVDDEVEELRETEKQDVERDYKVYGF